MEAKELRIGNLVDLGNRIAKIVEIGHLSCVVVDLEETQDTIEDYERVKPIPLTDEWLVKFGFEKKEVNSGGGINELLESYIYRGYEFMKDYNNAWFICGYNWNTKHFKYVHQLQNLYFALTGKELIVK